MSVERYARQTALRWFGADGQRRLGKKSALIVGCGGTGCACASFLVRAGLGRVLVVDPDIVSLTDLHRQILYGEVDAEHLTSKACTAADALRSSNREACVEAMQVRFTPENGSSLIAGFDLLLDCTDNFETRMLINDVCLKCGVDWVHGACTGTAGMVIPFPAAGGVCYRCIVDHIPSGTAGGQAAQAIFGPAAGIVGCLEAAEAIKMLIAPESVRPRIVFFDLLSDTHETIGVGRKKDCPACVGGTYEYLERPMPVEFVDAGGGTAHLMLRGPVDLAEMRARLAGRYTVQETPGALRVLTGQAEVLVSADGTAVVRPARDLEKARHLVDDLIGG